jgi:hypothetical protein
MQKTVKVLTKSVLGFGLVLLLSGCLGNNPLRPIEVSAKPIDRPELVLPPTDELRLRPVEWVIINEANMEQKLAQLTANGQPLAIFALTGEGYENLGLNFSDIRALVQQQKEIILAYERYYKEAEQALEGAVQAQ